jgi:hypothetical protein
MRTVDKKHLCGNLIIIKTPLKTDAYNYLQPRERWCYENIPEDHLWYSEVVPSHAPYSSMRSLMEDETLTRYWFEHKDDAMLFKLIWKQ